MIIATQAQQRAMPARNESSALVRESAAAEEAVRRYIAACPYSYYFREVAFHFSNDVLVLEGRVPNFYLKQVVQTLLKEVEGVEAIDNRVEVVNSSGLSSE